MQSAHNTMQVFSQACVNVPISLNVLVDHRKSLQVGSKAQLECVKVVLDNSVATVWAGMILQINIKQVFLPS